MHKNHHASKKRIVKRARWPILKTWDASKDLGLFHIAKTNKTKLDCTHWCQGGVIHIVFDRPLLAALEALGPTPDAASLPQRINERDVGTGWGVSNRSIGGLSAANALARWDKRRSTLVYPWIGNPLCQRPDHGPPPIPTRPPWMHKSSDAAVDEKVEPPHMSVFLVFILGLLSMLCCIMLGTGCCVYASNG